jgi:hypothetical protein
MRLGLPWTKVQWAGGVAPTRVGELVFARVLAGSASSVSGRSGAMHDEAECGVTVRPVSGSRGPPPGRC